jgi:flagellar protein FliO/FliZ
MTDPSMPQSPPTQPAPETAAVATPLAAAPQAEQPILPRPLGKPQAITAQPAHTTAPSVGPSIGGTLFALAVVLGLVFALAWLAKRIPALGGQRHTGLRIVATLPLSPRERLLVVEVGEQQHLLASGAAGTRMLHTLAQPLPIETQEPTHTPFAQVLANHFRKKDA